MEICNASWTDMNVGLILGLHPANERRRYKVMLSLIGWGQTCEWYLFPKAIDSFLHSPDGSLP